MVLIVNHSDFLMNYWLIIILDKIVKIEYTYRVTNTGTNMKFTENDLYNKKDGDMISTYMSTLTRHQLKQFVDTLTDDEVFDTETFVFSVETQETNVIVKGNNNKVATGGSVIY